MIVPFEPEHLVNIRYQPGQAGGFQSRENAEAVAQGWCAYSAIHDGRALICAGITELWPGRAMAWAAFDYAARPVFLEAHRRTLLEIDRAPYNRLEMYVRPGFAEAARWAELLGFTLESCMKRGAPDGKDLLVYTAFKQSRAARELNGIRNDRARCPQGGRDAGSRV